MMPAKRAYSESTLPEEERNRVLMEHLPQVRYIARHIHDRLPQHVSVEDLVHAGIIGLIDALQKYDGSKNVQFKTYAKFRIRGAILDSLRELDWGPRDLRRKARRLEEVASRLGSELGRSANEQELADEFGVSLLEFQHMLNELEGLDLGTLQIESSESGRQEDLCEYLPGDADESPYLLCLRTEMKEMLAQAIGELSEKEQQVLSLYYYEEITMKEIGAVLGIGESRVSQIHSLAIVRLRARLQEKLKAKAVPLQFQAKVMESAMEGMWKRF